MSEKESETVITSPLLTPLQSFPVTVLLVDDQEIIAQAIEAMLSEEEDIVFHYCNDPSKALEVAKQLHPTVILQDLVMPQIDGLRLARYYRADSATRDIPMIVLSSKEDPKVKAEAFSVGANDYIVKLPDKIELVARIRYHSNGYIRLLERNEAYDKLRESQRLLNEELSEAAGYVRSLLPLPSKEPLITSWQFVPSAQLGGDAFGYHWVDDKHYALYLLDVCGHGVGAALLSISVVNVLRSRSLPHVDFNDPSAVLTALNDAFDMEKHNNMFFTMWYGVINMVDRTLTYSSGGHPPALLLQDGEAKVLRTEGLVVGAGGFSKYENDSCQLSDKGGSLYLYSDGVYEIYDKSGTMMRLEAFLELLAKQSLEGKGQPEAILQTMRSIQGSDSFNDDFSLLNAIIPSKK